MSKKQEKTTGLTRSYYDRSIKKLSEFFQHAKTDHRDRFTFEHGHTVIVMFQALESKHLSGLIALPTANVTLVFSNENEEIEHRFLLRFDRVFQRGGG